MGAARHKAGDQVFLQLENCFDVCGAGARSTVNNVTLVDHSCFTRAARH